VLAALAACGAVQAAEPAQAAAPPEASVALPAFAGASLPEGPPLDLQQALALALDGNPGLRAARQGLAATEGAVLQSQRRCFRVLRRGLEPWVREPDRSA
jgi:cobalt-zinc-cadmium efflux system outer membrane protein